MIRVFGAFLFCLVLAQFVHADGGWQPNDPDIVFSADLAETDGTLAYDFSTFNGSGTLNGGPARVIKSPLFQVAYGTTTFAAFPFHYVNFTRTTGEDIVFNTDARLNFSGKPFMVAVTFSLDSFTAGSRSVWNYINTEGVNIGWDWRIDNAGTLNFGFIGIADFAFNQIISDLNPHAYCAWSDGGSLVLLFVDGKLDKRIVTAAVINTGTAHVNIAKRTNGGHAEFGGGVGFCRIKKNVTTEQQAKALASAYYSYVMGYGNSNGSGQ